jgi:hypothetical protein
MLCRKLDDARPHPSSLKRFTCFRVDQERVVATVAHDVGEPYGRAVGEARRDPAEAMRADLIPPPGNRRPAVRRDEIDHLFVIESSAPPKDDAVGERLGRIGCHARRTLTPLQGSSGVDGVSVAAARSSG